MKGSLRNRTQFQRVYEQGDKVIARHLVAFRLGGVPELGIGIVASKKVGDAVRRNRAKRLLREALRSQRARLRPAQWLVLVARRSLVSEAVGKDALEQELRQALTQIDAIAEQPGSAPC